jgi:fructuronate reductase
VRRPSYDREAVETGIVHFGPGAFHRAHQADYVDRLLAQDPRWGIAAVSMRSAQTVERLARQNGLYTLAILDAEPDFRVLGPHTRFVGPRDHEAVAQLLSDPHVRIVSSTVTEKGYCLAPDGSLDFDHPDIAHDLQHPEQPLSLVGWLALGLGLRRRSDTPAFTPLCCDNMNDNGRKLGAAVAAFAARLDPELGAWIRGEVRFPNSMVDSITPATDDRTLEIVRQELGVEDCVPVRRESYAAWIIEDALPNGSPDLASVGAILTDDVAAYELAKLRILNGAHSSLAYTGLLLGHETMFDAMQDKALCAFARLLIEQDVIPTLSGCSVNLPAYTSEIFERFRNPAIGHKLAQIAWDGSQKLPYRLLGTIDDAITAGRPLRRLSVPIAAWMLFVEREARSGTRIVDPLGPELAVIGCSDDAPERLLDLRQIFPERLATNARLRTEIFRARDVMRSQGVGALLGEGM